MSLKWGNVNQIPPEYKSKSVYIHDVYLRFSLKLSYVIIICPRVVLNSSDIAQKLWEFKVRAATKLTSIVRELLDSGEKLSYSYSCGKIEEPYHNYEVGRRVGRYSSQVCLCSVTCLKVVSSLGH